MQNSGLQKFRRIVWGVLFLCLLCAVLRKFFVIWQADYPKELRETTTAYFAVQFAAGRNPYALSTLDTVLPSPTNLYGFVTPLLLAPFVRLFFFAPPLQVCETVLLFAELAGLAAFYRALFLQTRQPTLALLGTILVYGCFYRFTPAGGAFPDSLGLSLTLILLWWVLHDKKSGRFHPFGYAALIVLLFYTKQYFIFCIPGLAVYLWLFSRRDFFRFALAGVVIGLCSLPLVNLAFPLFFPCSFAVAQSSTATGDWVYSLRQIFSIGIKRYFVVTAVCGVFALAVLFRAVRQRRLPVQLLSSAALALCQAVCSFPFVALIAQNKGTEYTYYLQLWFPYLIFIAMAALSLLPEFRLSSLALVCVCLISLVQLRTYVWSRALTEAELAQWQDAESMVLGYAADGEVLVAAEFSNICLENGIPTAEYGQAEYNEEINYLQYQASPLWSRLFPQAERIFQNNVAYYAQLRKDLQNHRYALVAVNTNGSGSYQLSDAELLDCGYIRIKTETLVTGGWTWKAAFYVPSGSAAL